MRENRTRPERPDISDQASSRRRIEVLGCPVDALSLTQTIAWVDRHLQVLDRKPVQHFCVNAANLLAMRRDEALCDAVRKCELISADGQSIVWAARWLGYRLPERVAGPDLLEALVALAAERGYRVYFFGARQSVVEIVVRRYQAKYPSLMVVGWRNGYFSPEEEAALVTEIRDSRPDLLFVAMGTPLTELFLARHGASLGIPFAMGVGGSFDITAGLRWRAPRVWQYLGLEWLYRLLQEPRRMWRRYVVGNPVFLCLIVKAKWQQVASSWAKR